MAIFTNKEDFTIPIFSQILQLNPNNGEELGIVMGRAATQLQNPEMPDATFFVKNPVMQWHSVFRDFCRVMQSMLPVVYHENRVPSRDLQTVEAMAAAPSMFPAKIMRLMPPPNDGELVGYTNDKAKDTLTLDKYEFKILRLPDGFAILMEALWEDFVRLLAAQKKNGNALAQCPECGNIYTPTPAREQIYCSRRCVNRHNARKMRQKRNKTSQRNIALTL